MTRSSSAGQPRGGIQRAREREGAAAPELVALVAQVLGVERQRGGAAAQARRRRRRQRRRPRPTRPARTAPSRGSTRVKALFGRGVGLDQDQLRGGQPRPGVRSAKPDAGASIARRAPVPSSMRCQRVALCVCDAQGRARAAGSDGEIRHRPGAVLAEAQHRARRQQSLDLAVALARRLRARVREERPPRIHVGRHLAALGRHGPARLAAVEIVERGRERDPHRAARRNRARRRAAVALVHHADHARLGLEERPGREARPHQALHPEAPAGVRARLLVSDQVAIRQHVVVAAVEAHHDEGVRHGLAAGLVDHQAVHRGADPHREHDTRRQQEQAGCQRRRRQAARAPRCARLHSRARSPPSPGIAAAIRRPGLSTAAGRNLRRGGPAERPRPPAGGRAPRLGRAAQDTGETGRRSARSLGNGCGEHREGVAWSSTRS